MHHGNPSVAFKETITAKSIVEYLHKKQSEGSGQYDKVFGYIEPLEEELIKKGRGFRVRQPVIGTNIPTEFIPSCEKAGLSLACVWSSHTDGAAHKVDPNDLSFQLAVQYGIRQAAKTAKPQVLQPIMNMDLEVPSEFQGVLVGALNKRGGLILNSDLNDDGSQVRNCVYRRTFRLYVLTAILLFIHHRW
jgi:elongation factor G